MAADKRSAKARAAAGQRDEEEDGSSLPQRLDGVPDSLRAWWGHIEPSDLERVTLRSGRCDVLAHVAKLVAKSGRVLDLGCGPGLLAKEACRRDIVGVDMTPVMVRAARQWMDVVLPDNILEHFPSEQMDAVVLCNVVEPYSAQVRRLLFSHAREFLGPSGRLIVVVASSTSGLGCASECGLDLIFPTVTEGTTRPDDIEEDMLLAGLDISAIELVETKTLNHTAVLPGQAPKAERRTYTVLSGRLPA
uniref:Methyltransferase domain-containing protein n=1 Tax=Pyrodinium bahamense TaxID=73915 RepID=A0A7S0B1P3_9DINO